MLTNIIASFPRSGNHWVRYIIEYFSRRPTLGEGDQDWATNIDGPIFKRLNRPEHYIIDRPISIKRHKIRNSDLKNSSLILIVRDYREAIIRHGINECYINDLFKNKLLLNNMIHMYIDLLVKYQNWKAPKLRVQYEELITNPKEEIEKILEFLNIETNNLDEFMTNYNIHKNNSVNLYGNLSKSYTKGNDIKFHANNCPKEQLSILDKMYWSAHNASSLNNRLS